MRVAKDENSTTYACFDRGDIDLLYNKYGIFLSECKLYKILNYEDSQEMFILSGNKIYSINYLQI